MTLLQTFTLVFGLIIALFGLSLILFKNFWRGFGKGVGEMSAGVNNFKYGKLGMKFKGVDEKHTPSNKGMMITGIIFIIFGIIVILIPYF